MYQSKTLRMEENKTLPILAWDYSGSTGGSVLYHSLGSKYLAQFQKSLDPSTSSPPIYLTWTDKTRLASLSELQKIIAKKEGDMGTHPSTLVQWILNNDPSQKQPIDLWLITDGEIGSHELQICSSLNKKVNYHSISFIVINSAKTNLSVGSSFFSGSRVKIYYNTDLVKEVNTVNPFSYDEISASKPDFEEKFQKLSDFIQAKFMGVGSAGGTDALNEAEKLNKLRKRILREIEEQNGNKPKEEAQSLDFSNKSALIEWLKETKFYASMKNVGEQDLKVKVDKAISTLINYIHHDNQRFEFFDIMKMEHKQQKFGQVEDNNEPELTLEELELLEIEESERCNFLDAVTLEEDQNSVPVLLLNITDLIDKYWVKGNYNKFQKVADCPLFGDWEKNCLGHGFGVETVIELYKQTKYNQEVDYDHEYDTTLKIKDPLTNKALFGGLILLNNEKADKWNDYLLMKTFFKGKKIKACLPLMYYKISNYAKEKDWIPQDVAKLLEIYALRRIKSYQKSPLALGSLPLDPKEIVPLPLALFYCTEGSLTLFSQDKEHFMQERLRQFFPVAADFVAILQKLKVQIDSDMILQRAKIFGVIHKLKTMEGSALEKKYWLLSKCFELDGKFLTFNVKDKEFVQYLNLLSFDHRAQVPLTFSHPELNKFVLISYDSNDDDDDDEDGEHIPICKETMRPQFLVKSENCSQKLPNYKKILSSCKEVFLGNNGEIVKIESPTKLDQSKLLSSHKNYINATIEGGKYLESLEQFEEFVWKDKRFSDGKVRLFSPKTRTWNKKVFEDYFQQIQQEIPIQEFLTKAKETVSVQQRVHFETKLKYTISQDKVNTWRKEWLVGH